ncbi:hypothetical protein V6617_16815 [Pelagibacterium nitratireducens]|uniref:DUF5681 domain-containing protein n=1 Tax=Pelagibacterium nitratireducens TaxID=1046114 RepID=A0ABZ2I466_9HYPH
MMNAHNFGKSWAPERTPRGQFAKGSGGRPHGVKGKKSREALEQVKSFGPDALAALRESVVAKERWAVEYVLNRLLPSSGRLIEFEDMTPEDVSGALKDGDISPVEAKDVAAALAKLAEVSDIEQLRERLDELEKAFVKGPNS